MTTTAAAARRRPRRIAARLDPGRAAHLRHRRRAVATSTSASPRATPALVAEIRALLLKHRVLFFRDQDITRAEHVAFARHFGELEDHPVAGSDPENPGLVRIYKSPDTPNDRYENAWHTDATWREKPPFGCVLRCVECPPVGGDTMWANMALAYERLPEHDQDADRAACAPATASRPASARRCRSRSAWRCTPSFPTPSTRWCARIPRRARRCCSSTPSPRTSPTSTPPNNVRSARTTRPARAQLLQYLISQAVHPRVPGALPLEAQQRGDVGQPLDPALRGDGLPALPPQDGTRRHRRRSDVLNLPLARPRSPTTFTQRTSP